jgi:hypothetical protein
MKWNLIASSGLLYQSILPTQRIAISTQFTFKYKHRMETSKQSPRHHFALLESWIMWKLCGVIYAIGKFKGKVFLYTIGLLVNNINTNIK